jgi:hypothetical protein
MSIYPVRISEWYPPGDDNHGIAYYIVVSSKCIACGKKPRWKSAVAHHSLPHGNGEVWCSWKCCCSGRFVELDKRQLRKAKRNMKFSLCEPIEVEIKYGPI